MACRCCVLSVTTAFLVGVLGGAFMSERKQYHIGRAHDADFEPKWVTVPDYYPLTSDEIASLLLAAQGTSDAFEVWSIGMRLCQGIWGHTSAIALQSVLAYAVDRVLLLYQQNYHQGPFPELVAELRRWMLYPFHVRDWPSDLEEMTRQAI